MNEGYKQQKVASSSKKKVTRQLVELIRLHFRRITLELVLIFLDHDWIYRLVGLINKKISLIESVFLVYPASEKYALAYFYPGRIRRHAWKPGPFGLLWQNGKLTIMFGVAASNGMFTNPENAENLKHITRRMEELRLLFGANRKTFAGILPGILYFKRILREAPEADLTAVAVAQAVDQVMAKESLETDTPIILLGGKGFIGRRVHKLLPKNNVVSIDIAENHNTNNWPTRLQGKRVIVLNITRDSALSTYLEMIWPGSVVLNEVYPEPSPDVLKTLREKDCPCYHVVGIQAFAIPQFPYAYEGAIPCCAAWPSAKMEVVVRKMN